MIMLTNLTKIGLRFLIMIKFNHIQILNTVPKKLYVKFYHYISICFKVKHTIMLPKKVWLNILFGA